MMSPSDEERIVAMVDSFTKTVARNFSRNLKRAKANAEKHYSDEPVDYLLETLSHDDRYPSDHFVLYADELQRGAMGCRETVARADHRHTGIPYPAKDLERRQSGVRNGDRGGGIPLCPSGESECFCAGKSHGGYGEFQ